MSLFQSLFGLNRKIKRKILVSIDILLLLCSFLGAVFVVSYDRSLNFDSEYWWLMAIFTGSGVIFFSRFGVYNAVTRHITIKFVFWIVLGVLLSSSLLLLGALIFNKSSLIFSIPVCMAFSLVSVSTIRLLLGSLGISRVAGDGEPVVIYGAGIAGRQLHRALSISHEYNVVQFVDDDPELHGQLISAVKVISPVELTDLVSARKVSRVLLAIPSAPVARRKSVLLELEKLAVKVLILPSMADLVSGNKLYSDIRDVEVDDLLGREPVEPNKNLMRKNITDKVVMVTGAGGSIGSELCRQIIAQEPSMLILYELSEFSLYSIDKELNELVQKLGLSIIIKPILGSVQCSQRLTATMEAFRVKTLYHAAAYKHVPLVEHNVVEGVRNNIFGTLYTAQAAIEANVETFVLISTDKAVRPTNVMGTTKRLAELSLQALSKEKHNTRFCMVRFGNVLGSSGSVVPLFRKQIHNGGPVTVTHADITRYFMTIPEASQLVIQAGTMGKGGDVFVLDMGEPVRITDLAKKMIHLSGFEIRDENNSDGDIEIRFSGLRPGEKLYEELLIGDNVTETEHERIMTANEIMLSWDDYKTVIDKLDRACSSLEHDTIREILLSAPTGFTPKDDICDLVWLANS